MLSSYPDKAYECPSCDKKDLTEGEGFNDRTWTCNTCGEPIHIKAEDDDGNRRYLVRLPAKELTVGKLVVLNGQPLNPYHQVLASDPAPKGKWRIALKGYRVLTEAPDEYFHTIIGSW